MNNCENCIEGRPRIGRLAGVTRTMRLAIFEGEGVPTGTPQDLTAQTVVVRVLLDGTNDIYVPDFVVEGTGNNVIKFVWPANRQAVGNYTLDVTMTDGGNNVNRVNWHGKDGIRLVQYSNQVYGEDATGQESSEAVGLVGYFTTNGVGMSAFDEWRGSEYSEGYPQTVAGFMAYLKQPATDAANAARQQMQQIQSRADEDHTRAGNDHSTAESDHTRAEGDHTTAASDHTTAAADHTAAAADHTQAGNDHTRAEGDHTTAASDHTQAAADHTQAASDHSAAASDHTRAGQDHTRSGSDHEIAVADHAQAAADHTRAESDHGTAAADHTQAGADHSTVAADHTLAASDHSTAAEDHTQAVADHAVMAGYDTRLTNVETDVTQLGQDVDKLEEVKEALLDISEALVITKDDFSIQGVYATTGPTISANTNYKATPIYNVTPGDVFVWSSFPTPPTGNFCLSQYASDGTPVDAPQSTNNRALFHNLSNLSYTVPQGVGKIGFIWNFNDAPLTASSKITCGEDTFALTTDAVTMIKDECEIDDLEEDVATLEETTQVLDDTVDAMLESQPAVAKHPEDFTTTGLYKASVAEVDASYTNYRAIALINVVEGQIIKWHKWQHGGNVMKSVAAAFCYDNDGLPYDGSSARLDYDDLTTYDVDTGEFTLKIPSNCSQIGLCYNFTAYPTQTGAEIEIQEKSYALTDLAKELINNAIEPSDAEGSDSAKYYLKGNSNIVYSSSKKLGIISAGQSNIDGRNSYSDFPSWCPNPNSKVHFKSSINAAFSPFEVTNGGQNNDWSFDAIVYNLLTDSSHANLSDIYVMKTSMGGTSIDAMGATDYHWTADYEFLSSESKSLLRTFEKTVRAGVSSDGSNFDIKAMLWHQGEGDMQIEQVANRYYENLKNMLAYVRGFVGNPRLHVFCGNISLNRTSPGFVAKINAAYTKLAAEDPYLHVVDMSNAGLEDGYHFNYQWSIYFGQKVYDMMIDAGIITGTKINPSEPS